MKKYIKTIFLWFILLMFSLSIYSFAQTSNLNTIDVNDINLNSIKKSKVDDLKKVLNNIDINNISSATVLDNIDKNEMASGNIDINSIDTNSIDMNEVIGIYQDLSKVISNEEIADLIKDNSKLLSEAGVDSTALSASEKLLRTFDANAVIDIVQNDLDINNLIEMYKNGASLEDIISSVITGTSTQTKLKIISKLLFSNKYFKMACVVLVFYAIYSILITGLIFKKASKKGFATFIPLYRDIVHLSICSFSPWLLLLLFIPVLGWLILAAIAVIGRFELSRNFGHGFFFGLGLLFFPIIFRSIIAFSNDEYVGDLDEDDD